MSLTAVSSSIDDIENGAAKLNTSAQRYRQETQLGFEPTIFCLVGGHSTTRPLGLDNW